MQITIPKTIQDKTNKIAMAIKMIINHQYNSIFKYKNIYPNDRYLIQSKNPPIVKIEFYENINNLKQISCFSNEGNKWRNSKISFIEKNTLKIDIMEKFVGERGRINCSLKEIDGFWRWLGIQFVVSDK